MTVFSRVKIYAPKLGRLIGAVTPVDAFDQVHVLFGQLKVGNLEILLQPLEL